ncbi:MAG TPA: TadA family conjugal transfer-associated ATPase [Actinomycetaceae bacterium]|nr:TadA family conjugal transfer-associated ATPase [Actinomycetaceae bacterium]
MSATGGAAQRALLDRVRRAVAAAPGATAVAGEVAHHAVQALTWRTLLAAEATARAQIAGAGPLLQPLLDHPDTTDVLVNGGGEVWVDRGEGLHRCAARLASDREVRELATRLAAACGQRLDDASPVVDGTLPDGTRLHAVLAPLSATGTLISLRTQHAATLTLDDLTARGAIPPQIADVLRALVAARANVLVSGAAGAGKTTLLAALLSLVPGDERIVCIEEAVELRPDHPHVVHLQVRRANVQLTGRVTMADLVRAAMRMRPDRLVLGECRGAEVREVLGALNTGHDGGWATVHANTSADVPARLLALGALARMSPATVRAQAVSALDAVVHLVRERGRRRIAEIALFDRAQDRFACTVALRVDPRGGVSHGPAWPRLARRLDASLGTAT